MTPAALTDVVLGEPARPAGRVRIGTASEESAWRTLVIFSAYRVVLALALSGAYAFLNALFQLGVQQPAVAITA